jgi:hypothetical protein
MRTKQIDTEATQGGFFAVLAYKDAIKQNSNNRSTYSDKDKLRVSKAEVLLGEAFKYTSMYTNFRKQFVAIKMAGALVRDRNTLIEVNSILEELGFTEVRESKQGVIYRMKRS